jgi:hypothetical protein
MGRCSEYFDRPLEVRPDRWLSPQHNGGKPVDLWKGTEIFFSIPFPIHFSFFSMYLIQLTIIIPFSQILVFPLISIPFPARCDDSIPKWRASSLYGPTNGLVGVEGSIGNGCSKGIAGLLVIISISVVVLLLLFVLTHSLLCVDVVVMLLLFVLKHSLLLF